MLNATSASACFMGVLLFGKVDEAGLAETEECGGTGGGGIGATDDNVIEDFERENATGFDKLAGDSDVFGTGGGVSGYAGCGITGVIPHPVLCRMDCRVPASAGSGQHPDAA
jgi:hypothetical protein